MRGWLSSVLLIGALALSGCDGGRSQQEQERKDEHDIAMVENANRGVAMPITPEPLLFPDIQQHHLFGTSCSFVPTGGGVGALAMAMADKGYMKVDGKVVRLAADSGSAKLPFGAHSKYDGKKFSFELGLAEASGKQIGAEATTYQGRLTARDGYGRVIYDKIGDVQCGS